MGFVIVLLIIVGIIILVSIFNKKKKEKGIATLESGDAGYMAHTARFVLEEKGYYVSQPTYSFNMHKFMQGFMNVYKDEQKNAVGTIQYTCQANHISHSGSPNTNVGCLIKYCKEPFALLGLKSNPNRGWLDGDHIVAAIS